VDRYRFIIGSLIVAALLILASAIALGHVEEKSSYGLTAVLAIIGKIALDFSGWAYSTFKKDDSPQVKERKEDNAASTR
jgi:hypothetical protein